MKVRRHEEHLGAHRRQLGAHLGDLGLVADRDADGHPVDVEDGELVALAGAPVRLGREDVGLGVQVLLAVGTEQVGDILVALGRLDEVAAGEDPLAPLLGLLAEERDVLVGEAGDPGGCATSCEVHSGSTVKSASVKSSGSTTRRAPRASSRSDRTWAAKASKESTGRISNWAAATESVRGMGVPLGGWGVRRVGYWARRPPSMASSLPVT